MLSTSSGPYYRPSQGEIENGPTEASELEVVLQDLVQAIPTKEFVQRASGSFHAGDNPFPNDTSVGSMPIRTVFLVASLMCATTQTTGATRVWKPACNRCRQPPAGERLRSMIPAYCINDHREVRSVAGHDADCIPQRRFAVDGDPI